LHFAGPHEVAPGHLADFVRARDPHALFVRFGRIDAQVLEAAPSLHVIARHGSGLGAIDLECARARGIVVTATQGANAVAVAEHALALLLACAKGIARLDARMHAGHWDKAAHQAAQLAGRTLGIIGLGAVGLRMAQLAGGVGMRVIAATRTPRTVPRHVRPVALGDLWPACDAISLHCALNAATKEIVNPDTLARCRRGVLLVNTGRGGLPGVKVQPAPTAGLSCFMNGDETLAPGLSLHPAPGHTPGQVRLDLKSGGALACFCGDVLHHPLQVAL
jgi:D-3-phosphoglycerate dehydrogenase